MFLTTPTLRPLLNLRTDLIYPTLDTVYYPKYGSSYYFVFTFVESLKSFTEFILKIRCHSLSYYSIDSAFTLVIEIESSEYFAIRKQIPFVRECLVYVILWYASHLFT